MKSPNPPGANRLIDLPPDEFLDTEDEFNVVAAGIWMLSVRWDEIPDDKRPKTRGTLREVSRSHFSDRVAQRLWCDGI